MTTWIDVKNSYPPNDEDIIYVGINTAGYCGCFTHYKFIQDVCLYETAEEEIKVMTGLKWWMELDRPIE